MVLAEEMHPDTRSSRLIVALAAVLLIHGILFFELQFPARILPEIDEYSVTVTFEETKPKPESLLDALLKVPLAVPPGEAEKKTAEEQPAPLPPNVKTVDVIPALPAVAVVPIPAPAPRAPALPPPLAQTQPPKLHEIALEELKAKSGTVFDESKALGTPPEDALLSDRNSSAADRGPKDLPRGEPYMDKGQSREIRYKEMRGENNLPAIASSANSGSVDKSGKKAAGEGGKAPRSVISPDADTAKNLVLVSPVAPKVESKPQPETSKRVPKAVAVPEPLAIAKNENGTPVSLDPAAKPPQESIKPAPEQHNPAAPSSPDVIAVAPVELAKKKQLDDELAPFKAILNGAGDEYRAGKVGPAARAGATGHEGDGTLRPGNAEAVSDVLTFNLESSAAEFDEARFAKKYDAVAAYLKPFMRRIDAKWKAEVYAGTRRRLDRGNVVMKIVLRKDGQLMEASEVVREPKTLPDYCVANAKRGIEAAADPKCDPFPEALSKRTSIEFVVNFGYR